MGAGLQKILWWVWDFPQAVLRKAPQAIRDGLYVCRRICGAVVILVLQDSFKRVGGFRILSADFHVVFVADRHRALAVASASTRADASDHEARDPQEEVRGLDRLLVGGLSPGLVDEGERAREDSGRRALREAQELVASRPRLWVDGEGHRVVDRDSRGRGHVREKNVTRVGS